MGRRGHAARRWAVRAGDHGRSHRTDRRRPRRRRVRVADDGARPGPQGRHAAVQVRRQPHPVHVPERDDRRVAQRVALGLPRLPRVDVGRAAVHRQLRRLRLRHGDHPPAARREEAHRRGADPDLLRRRDLSTSTGCNTPVTSPSTPSSIGWGRSGFGGGHVGRVREPYAFKPSAVQLARSRAADARGPSAAARAGRRLRAGLAGRRADRPRPPGDGRRRRRRRRRRDAYAPLPARRPRAGAARRGRWGLRRGRCRGHRRAPAPAAAAAGSDVAARAPRRHRRDQRAQLRSLVPACPRRCRPLRLRPARHPRSHAPALLHPPLLPAHGQGGGAGARVQAAHRSAARRTRRRRREAGGSNGRPTRPRTRAPVADDVRLPVRVRAGPVAGGRAAPRVSSLSCTADVAPTR